MHRLKTGVSISFGGRLFRKEISEADLKILEGQLGKTVHKYLDGPTEVIEEKPAKREREKLAQSKDSD